MLLREFCQGIFVNTTKLDSDKDVLSRVIELGLGEPRAISEQEKRLKKRRFARIILTDSANEVRQLALRFSQAFVIVHCYVRQFHSFSRLINACDLRMMTAATRWSLFFIKLYLLKK
jgi:hypothetical protein